MYLQQKAFSVLLIAIEIDTTVTPGSTEGASEGSSIFVDWTPLGFTGIKGASYVYVFVASFVFLPAQSLEMATLASMASYRTRNIAAKVSIQQTYSNG